MPKDVTVRAIFSTKFDNALPKRDGGFASHDAAKMAAREDAKKMRLAPKSERRDVGRIMVGQNKEEATRY